MKKAMLLYWIKAVNHYGRHRTFLKEKDAKECEQALEEIVAILKNFDKECVKSYKTGYKAGVIEKPQHDEKTERELQEMYSDKKPGVTEEWIEEKATKFLDDLCDYDRSVEYWNKDLIKDFIRSLMGEVNEKK